MVAVGRNSPVETEAGEPLSKISCGRFGQIGNQAN